MPDSTEEGLRSREGMYALVFTLAAFLTSALIAFAPDKFLGSVAWQYILDHLPGSRTTLLVWLLIAAVGMVASLAFPRMPARWWPYVVGGAWYLWVATFQVVCALSETNGPLGFMGWGPYGIVVLIFGLGRLTALK